MTYREDKLSFNTIEKAIQNTGAYITNINIHFPSSVTGIADPYGASAASITIEENLKTIEGVLSSGISSRGELKVEMDTLTQNKQIVIDEIVKFISSLHSGKRQ